MSAADARHASGARNRGAGPPGRARAVGAATPYRPGCRSPVLGCLPASSGAASGAAPRAAALRHRSLHQPVPEAAGDERLAAVPAGQGRAAGEVARLPQRVGGASMSRVSSGLHPLCTGRTRWPSLRRPANSGPAHGEKSALPMRQELRQKWIAAGYVPTMGSAEVVPPPPRGIRRVYHFTRADFAKKDIVRQRLKVARISQLNDSFEFLFLNFRQMQERQIIDYFKDNYDKDTGLLCFSQNWTSPVLWSHYADKHRGICLGFDIREDLLKKVNYIEKRAMIPAENEIAARQALEELKEFCVTHEI
jgi:hypothetical protein